MVAESKRTEYVLSLDDKAFYQRATVTHISLLPTRMGQSMQIFSPSAAEALGFWGKLSEILFDGSAQCLVRLFAVHVSPLNSV